jgi:dephospho-CoA kinase
MILGITGNIASGKSRVAARFARLGAVVVSADQLAREAVAPGSDALRALVRRFGDRILREDGDLDREALGRIVFADSAARQELEAITHPAIARLADERLASLRAEKHPLVVYEAPLLFEANAVNRVDRVLLVAVAPEVQLARLMARDGLDEEASRQRIEAQMPQADKVARADYVITNSGDWDACERQVDALFEELRQVERQE